MAAGSDENAKAAKNALTILIVVTVASLCAWEYPAYAWLLWPVKRLVTALHELGHALGCLLTGGQVTGLTIVADGEGHGGLTMTEGGLPWIYGQTGYLGCAVFGCLFLYLGRSPRAARHVLAVLGVLVVAASIVLMSGAIHREGKLWEGAMSVVAGVGIGGLLIWAGLKLRPETAQWILIFLAVQTALNCMTDLGNVWRVSTGMVPFGSYTDASTMAEITGVPAPVWTLFWALASGLLLAFTVWFSFLRFAGGSNPAGKGESLPPQAAIPPGG